MLYILQSLRTGSFYVGATENLSVRLEQHNAPGKNPSRWTRTGGPWKLVFSQEFGTSADTLRAERFIKRMKSRKFIEKLIRGEHKLGWD